MTGHQLIQQVEKVQFTGKDYIKELINEDATYDIGKLDSHSHKEQLRKTFN